MPSDVLNYARQKYPSVADASDKDLTVYIGNKYPSLLKQDEQFASEFKSYTAPEHSFSEDFGKSFVASIIHDTPAAIYSTLQSYFTGMGEVDLSAFEVVSPVGMALRTFAPETSKSVRDTLGQTMKELADESKKMGQALRETGEIAKGVTDAKFDRGVDQDSWGSTFGAGAGSLVPIFATGGALGVAGVTGRAAYGTVMAVGGLQEFGSTFQTAQEKYYQAGIESGLTEEQAAKQAEQKAMLPAAARGGTVVALMAAGGTLAKKLGATNIEGFAAGMRNPSTTKALDTVAKGAGLRSTKIKWNEKLGKFTPIPTGAVIEGGEEAGTSWIGEYLIARHSYDPSVTFEQANAEAWKSFVVGGTLGGVVGGVQKMAESAPDPIEAAKRDTIRKVAPSTASKLDEMDAASRVLPDEEVGDAVTSPDGTDPDVIDIRRSKTKDSPAREAVVKKLTKDGKVKMPSWWDRYEGTPDPEGSPTDAPTGLRYADQSTVDRFIENEEAKNELSKVSVEQDENGEWELKSDGKAVDLFENEAEANEAARSLALSKVNPATKKRIKDFKKLTKDLRRVQDLEIEKQKVAAELEQEKKIQEGSLRRVESEVKGKKVTRIEEVGPEERLPDVTDEDITFVAEALGIKEEDLPYSLGRDSNNNINITPEMVSELRSAPEAGVAKFLQQAQAKRDAEQLKSEFDTLVAKGEQLAELERQQAQAEAEAANAAIIAGQTLRVREDRAELSRAAEEATTPDTVQLAEFTEEKLESGDLTATEASILNRLQERKVDLIADSVELDESQQQETLKDINNIDNQIANILSAEVRTPTPVTAEQLAQLQQAYGMSAPDVEADSQPTIKIGDTVIRITDGTASSPTPAASPLSQRAQAAAAQVALARFQATRLAEASAKADADIAERKLQQEREANLQAQRDRRNQPQEIDQKQVLDKVSEALSRLEKRFKGLLGLSEIQITQQDSGAGVYSLAADGITNTILVDPKRLAETMRKSKNFSLEKALEEELIHNLDGQALQAEYTRQISNGELSSSVTLSQFIQKQYSDVAKGMTPEERSSARQLYGEEFKDDIHMAQEFVRQLIQKRHSKTITEESYRKGPIRKLLEMLSRAFQTMSLSKPLTAHVKNLESFLERTYKKEMSDAKTAAEKQKVKESRESKRYEIESRDHNNALTAIDKELARNGKFITGSNDYQVARDKGYDEWRRLYEKGQPIKMNLIVYNAVGKVLRENKAKKRGGDFNITSLDRLAEEGVEVGTDLTPAGESMTQFLSSQKSKLGLTDQESDYLVKYFFTNTPQKTVVEITGLKKSRVSQIHNAALRKIRNRVINDPEFFEELIQTTENPELFTQPRGPIGASSVTASEALADPKTKGVYKILSQIGDFKKKVWRFFDSSGGLRMPSVMSADKQLDFFQKKIEKDAYINSVMGEVRASNRRLQSAVKNEFGKEPSPEQVSMMNDALAGDPDAIGKLPEDIRNLLAEMRQQIDGLSKHIVNKGWVNGELKAKIEGNLETYIARSYRIFDNPEYIDNIDPEVVNKAVNFIEKQLLKNGADPLTSQQQAIIEVNDMLAKYSDKGGRESLNSGRLGEKDLSLFMKRKDIAPEIRALLGEYTDPVMNYTRSVTRMAHFVANHKFLTDVKKIGLGEVFFEESDLRRGDLEANTKIAGTVAGVKVKEGEEDASRGSYSPLAGLYTTKEINAILNEYNTMSNIMTDSVFGTMAKFNVLSKSTKTVMSVMTHVRNAMGQIPFSILNGHNPFAYRKAYKAFKAIFADASGIGLAKGGKEARDKAARDSQAYFNKMTRLGLVGEEMTTAELQRVLSETQAYLDESTNAEEFLSKATGGMLAKAQKAGKVSFETLTRIYRASDELGKIMNFEMEKEQLRPLYPELTAAELDTLAAKRTRGGIPTYSEMPPAIQRLRMQPFVGPFMSFFYEAIRTQVNNLKYASIEFKKGGRSLNPMNPYTQYAARRIGGHLAVTGVFSYALTMLSEMFGGVSEEEQEDVRTLLADYEKDSQFYFYRDENKQIKYINFSFNNPYAATTDPIMSALGLNGIQEEGMAANLTGKMVGMMQPFTSETIVAQATVDLLRNTTQYGTEVYNEEASDLDKALDGIVHIARSITPGTADRIVRRMVPAFNEETLPSGEDPKLTDELAAEFTGFRVRTIDYQDKLTKTSYGTARRFRNASKIFTQVASSRGTVSDEDMIDSYSEANESRLRIFKEVKKQINAALLSGVSKSEVFTALKAGNLSKADIQHILRGQYRPLDVSESVRKRAKQANHPIPLREISQIKREYLRKPLDDEDSE